MHDIYVNPENGRKAPVPTAERSAQHLAAGVVDP